DDQQRAGLELEEAQVRAHALAAHVHEGRGLEERELAAALLDLRDPARELGLLLPGRALGIRNGVHPPEARVVTRPLVLRPRISEPYDQLDFHRSLAFRYAS